METLCTLESTTAEVFMKVGYDRQEGVYIVFEKEEDEIQLALNVLEMIVQEAEDSEETEKIERLILSIIESENSTLQ